MIEYTQDFSIPQVQELLVQKTINTKGVRQARLVFHLELAMLGLITLCLWLCADKFSFLFPLALAVLLIIGGGYKKSQEAGVRKDLRTEITSGDVLRKVQVDEQGVRVCREDRDTLYHWSNFVSWGIKDRTLYLETNTQTYVFCHQRQVSAEDFAAIKALAARQIGKQS